MVYVCISLPDQPSESSFNCTKPSQHTCNLPLPAKQYQL